MKRSRVQRFFPILDAGQVREPALKARGIAAIVRLDGGTLHPFAALNADQYAVEMRGQWAMGGLNLINI